MRLRWLFAAFLLFLPVHAAAFTIYPIPYSGQLTEGGVAITGTRFFAFTLYDAATGGTVIRAQSESLLVLNGVYHTTLFTLPGDWVGTGRWLGVSVNSAPEMTPRVGIGMVPYAVHAVNSDTALVANLSNWVSPAGFHSHVSTSTVFFGASAAWAPIDSITVVAPTDCHVLVQAVGVWGLFSTNPSSFYQALSVGPPITADMVTGSQDIQASQEYVVAKDFDLTAGTYNVHVWGRIAAVGQSIIVNPGFIYWLIFPKSSP